MNTNELMQATNLDEIAAANGMSESRSSKSHAAKWDNIQVQQFARIAQIVFGGQVAVLPSASVWKQAQIAAKKAKAKIAVSVEVAETPAGNTIYKVGDSILITA